MVHRLREVQLPDTIRTTKNYIIKQGQTAHRSDRKLMTWLMIPSCRLGSINHWSSFFAYSNYMWLVDWLLKKYIFFMFFYREDVATKDTIRYFMVLIASLVVTLFECQKRLRSDWQKEMKYECNLMKLNTIKLLHQK